MSVRNSNLPRAFKSRRSLFLLHLHFLSFFANAFLYCFIHLSWLLLVDNYLCGSLPPFPFFFFLNFYWHLIVSNGFINPHSLIEEPQSLIPITRYQPRTELAVLYESVKLARKMVFDCLVIALGITEIAQTCRLCLFSPMKGQGEDKEGVLSIFSFLSDSVINWNKKVTINWQIEEREGEREREREREREGGSWGIHLC